MRIVAHRGTRIHAPENSRQALLSAYTAGADVLEFDVQLTSDGKLVVSHDGTIDRLTGEAGTILEMTRRELRHTSGKFDFSASFNPYGVAGFSYYRPARRLQIENFEDLLDLLPHDVWKLIELKHDSSPNDAIRSKFVTAAVSAVRARGLLDGTVLYSKDTKNITLARELAPEVKIVAFDWERNDDGQLALLEETGADGIVTELARVVTPAGQLTPFAERFAELFENGDVSLGLLLYPYRKPGVFLETEYRALQNLPFVWSLSTDTLLGAEVEGSRVDVETILGRRFDWIAESFAGRRVDRDIFSLGYAKANRWCEVKQDDGIRIETKEYDGYLPPDPTGDPLTDKVHELELRLLYAEKSWPYYSGGGVGLVLPIVGDFAAEVDYELSDQITQAQTLEMAVTNVDPGSHQPKPPTSFRGADAFYDPHGCPPYVGVEHDEDDGYRINWNLGADYDNNQYGPPVGDGKTPKAGRLRLERRGAVFSAYYRNANDAPDWICVGVVRNESLNDAIYLRCVAKRWRQEREDNPSEYYDIKPNIFTFKNLTVRRTVPTLGDPEK